MFSLIVSPPLNSTLGFMKEQSMKDEIEQGELSNLLVSLERDVVAYFDGAEAALKDIPRPARWDHPDRDHFWGELPEQLREQAEGLVKRLLDLAGAIADAVRNAPLASEADQRDCNDRH
jgi:hypothetical protein